MTTQDYQSLSPDELEVLEKQTHRILIQALQQYSKEARYIFDRTKAESETEVIAIAEDIVQYALEVAEIYPINSRFAGFFDYKRVRWLPTAFGLVPQVLLVDAKASTENNRTTLQQSQLSMDAEFESRGAKVTLAAGFAPHLSIPAFGGQALTAVTTSALVHFHYVNRPGDPERYRELKSIYSLLVPHQRLKPKYNPDSKVTFFGQGKHSPARAEAQRIRVYFERLRQMCPWRLQELRYAEKEPYTRPEWRDVDIKGKESSSEFLFIGR